MGVKYRHAYSGSCRASGKDWTQPWAHWQLPGALAVSVYSYDCHLPLGMCKAVAVRDPSQAGSAQVQSEGLGGCCGTGGGGRERGVCGGEWRGEGSGEGRGAGTGVGAWRAAGFWEACIWDVHGANLVKSAGVCGGSAGHWHLSSFPSFPSLSSLHTSFSLFNFYFFERGRERS